MKRIKKSISSLVKRLHDLDKSKVFAGLSLLIMNIISKHVSVELTKGQKELFKQIGMKQILIFSIAWVGCHDTYISLLITCGYFFVFELLLNARSQLCIMPESYKPLETVLDTNNDGHLSESEIEHAINIIKKYKDENKNNYKL